MRVLSFNYTKILAEKYSNNFKDLKIETSLNIQSIEESSSKVLDKGITILEISFTSLILYSPEISKIELGGKIVLSVDSKLAKEILKSWKKKELEENFKLAIFNGILTKTNIKSLEIEDELNLPPHFRLPSLSPQKKE